MPPEEKGEGGSQEEDAVRHLRDKLYSRKNEHAQVSDIRTPLPKNEAEAPVSWTPAEESAIKKPHYFQPPVQNRMSLPAKFLLGSVLFFILAAGAAAYMFFGGGNLISPQNIDIQTVAPSLIDSGKAATFQILINNRNTSALNLADLIVDYPSGTRDPAKPTQALQHERQSIGTINPGEQVKRTISGIFFGGEGSQEKVMVTLEYTVAGSNAIFQKQSEVDFVIGSSPVSLNVDVPSEVLAGQAFPIDVTVQSNSTETINNVVVQAIYPFGYSLQNSSPQAASGGTFWRLGTMQSGSKQVVHLTGAINGSEGDQRVFKFLVGSNTENTDSSVKVPLLTVPQTVSIHKPFITGTILVNGQNDKSVSVAGGQTLQGSVSWQNNLSTSVSNAKFTLSFSGPALDKNSITSANGFYQSQNSSIIWSNEQDPSLASIPPGGSGTLQFSFATLPPGANNVLVTNPTININLAVSGTPEGQDGSLTQVNSAAYTQISIASVLSLAAQALHFTAPFPNSGPMPPKVESETSYAIVWTLKNSSNTIGNATVSTVLPSYVRFVPAGAQGVAFDESSRTVTWSVGDLKAGVGYSEPAKQVAFQVVLTPSVSQVSSAPALTGQTVFKGQDTFAHINVQTSAPAPTTSLTGDSGYTAGMGVVAPK